MGADLEVGERIWKQPTGTGKPLGMDDEKCFHVTIKGLVFDERGAVLLLREPDGIHDLPGGRLEHGESFAQCLERECREEIGVGCKVLDVNPRFAWTARDKTGIWRLVLCFRVDLEQMTFRESDECIGHEFVSKRDFGSFRVAPQIRPLEGFW